MSQQHSITPPPELVQQWYQEADSQLRPYYVYIATQAAQWGSDQELEACCKWLARNYNYPRADHPLRAARRPKPQSLKQQALAELVDAYDEDKIDDTTYDTIRRALEALDD